MGTDVILTKTELEDVFYNLTVSIMNNSPNFDVRHSWPKNGAPAFGVDDNIAFLKIYDIPSSVTQQRENIYTQEGSPEAGNMETVYTRTLRVDWCFYGPDSWDNVNTLKNGLFFQENHDILAQSHIFMVPDFPPLRRVPELWASQWYERCDLSINFNEGISINRNVPAIETVGIIVIDKDGIVVTVNITESTVVIDSSAEEVLFQGGQTTWQEGDVNW